MKRLFFNDRDQLAITMLCLGCFNGINAITELLAGITILVNAKKIKIMGSDYKLSKKVAYTIRVLAGTLAENMHLRAERDELAQEMQRANKEDGAPGKKAIKKLRQVRQTAIEKWCEHFSIPMTGGSPQGFIYIIYNS